MDPVYTGEPDVVEGSGVALLGRASSCIAGRRVTARRDPIALGLFATPAQQTFTALLRWAYV